ncbi:unnamed protein product [Closterium sp. Yama58-4]|nr:unnamed protein product [Closterium sp. Yama58-4]
MTGMPGVGRLGVLVAAPISFAQVPALVAHAMAFTLNLLRRGVPIFDLDYDAILAAMYALTVSAEGDCYLCVPPDPGIDPGIAPAALGASESALPGTASAQALHTFTLDSVLARSTTMLPCPVVPSGELFGFHLPSFSTNLVSNAVLQDHWVDTWTPGGQRVAICTCSRTGRHLATFTREPGSSLYTLTTVSRYAPLSPQLYASAQVATQCECRRLLRSLPTLPPSPAPPCIPCVEGRQRAAPHSSSFPPTEAPLQTLHLDVWGPARVQGHGRERYFLLVVDDYTRNTTVFPLQRKADVPAVLIPWIRAVRLQLRERFESDFPVLRLHSDRGGEFTSDLLRAFCAEHGITQSFTLPASPQQNGVVERRIGLVMEVARTSMIHAAAPHFLWPFAVRYAAHQLNLWPRVSLPETSPTLLWTGKVGDASRFRVWGARAFVRDTTADKLSAHAIPCVFLGFPPDAPGWQFYDPASRRVFASQDVTFDESVPFYRLFPYRTHFPSHSPPLFLTPGPPQVDPLPVPGPAPSGVSQVDPPVPAPVEVTGDSGPAGRGAVFGGAGPGGARPGVAEPGGAELGGAEPGGAESTREETGGTAPEREEPEGAEPGGAEPESDETGGTAPGGAVSGGAEPEREEPGGAGSGGAMPEGTKTAGARSPWSGRLRPRVPLTSQQLHEWYGRRQGRATGARGSAAGGASADVAGAGSGAGPLSTGGAGVAGPGGARTGGTRAAGAGGAVLEGATAGDTAAGDPGTGGAGSGGAAAGDTEAGDPGTGGAGSGGAAASGAGLGGAGAGGSGAAGGAGATGGS